MSLWGTNSNTVYWTVMGGEPGYFHLTDEKIKIVSKSKDVFYLLWGPYISNGSIHRTITSIVMFIFILSGDS